MSGSLEYKLRENARSKGWVHDEEDGPDLPYSYNVAAQEGGNKWISLPSIHEVAPFSYFFLEEKGEDSLPPDWQTHTNSAETPVYFTQTSTPCSVATIEQARFLHALRLNPNAEIKQTEKQAAESEVPLLPPGWQQTDGNLTTYTYNSNPHIILTSLHEVRAFHYFFFYDLEQTKKTTVMNEYYTTIDRACTSPDSDRWRCDSKDEKAGTASYSSSGRHTVHTVTQAKFINALWLSPSWAAWIQTAEQSAVEKTASTKSASLDKKISVVFRDSHNRRYFIFLFALILGAAAAAAIVFSSQVSIIALAASFGLASLPGLVVAFLAVTFVGALFAVEFLAFSERILSRNSGANASYMRNLIITTAVLGGLGVGLLLAAGSPLVLGFVMDLVGGGAPVAFTVLALAGLVASALLTLGLIGLGAGLRKSAATGDGAGGLLGHGKSPDEGRTSTIELAPITDSLAAVVVQEEEPGKGASPTPIIPTKAS